MVICCCGWFVDDDDVVIGLGKSIGRWANIGGEEGTMFDDGGGDG